MESEFVEFQKRLFDALFFILIFGCLAFALLTIPLLPLGLPLIISFLIAFVTLRNPKAGMTVASFLVGSSLIYHLARTNFMFVLSGDQTMRFLFVLALFLLFIFIPSSVESREDAVPIAIGMLAATLLFFEQTYYLSIPLVLIFAVIYKKARLGLTLSYYILISVPLQIMQYIIYGSETGKPPLYVPLTSIFGDIQESMSRLTFDEIFNVMRSILRQITGKPSPGMTRKIWTIRYLTYLNSFPGMLVFFLILLGLISVAALVSSYLVRIVKGVEVTRKYGRFVEMFLPLITAVSINILLWFLLDALQYPLEYEAARAEVALMNTVLSTLAMTGIMIPVSIGDYLLKRRDIVEARSLSLIEKARDVLARIQDFERVVKKVKSATPVTISSIEVKLSLIKDEVDDVISKSSVRLYSLSELDEKAKYISKNIGNELNSLLLELNTLLEGYYARAVHQHSLCVSKLKDIGLEVKDNVGTIDIDYFGDKDVDSKIHSIGKLLEGGLLLANETVQVFERIYNIVRSLYDPNLPTDSPTLIFVRQRLDEKTNPWIAIDAVCASLYNLEKQHSTEISRSIEHLHSSLTSTINLSTQERLLPVLGDSFPEILDRAAMAKDIKTGFETEELSVMKVVIIKDALESTLSIAKDLLAIFHRELKRKEEMIELLLRTKDHEWEKNVSLTERIAEATEIVSNPSNYQVNQLTAALYRSFACFDECIGTLEAYNRKYETLLNYPIAELVINRLIKKKKQVYAHELPFEQRCSEEYLRIYYRQRYAELFFDETNKLIVKRN